MFLKTTGRKYERIYDLGPEKVAIIDSMFMRGETATSVADYIQEELGELKEVSRLALEKQLRRYRGELDVKVEAHRQVALRDDTTLLKVAEKVEQIDVLDDMNHMITAQKSRINRLLHYESGLPLEKGLLPDVKHEMGLLCTMINNLAKLQLDTGVLRRAPKTVSGMFSYDDATGKFEFESKIEDHKALTSVTSQIMNILEGDYEEIEDDADEGEDGFTDPAPVGSSANDPH